MRRRSLLIGALLLAACAKTPAPSVTLPPGAEAPPDRAYLPGRVLTPDGALRVQALPGARERLLLANTAAESRALDWSVNPAGEPGPSPGPDPSASPGSEPGAPDGSPPPFGFGFGARPGVPPVRNPLIPDRRVAQAEMPPSDGATPQGAANTPRLGATLNFWINNGDTTLAGDRERVATLRLITPHAYFLVDEAGGKHLEESELQRLADAFEHKIRPAMTRVFGEENQPGIDGEPRLFIVLSDWVGQAPDRNGLMGYFWPRDPVAKVDDASDLRAHSNQKEVIFLSPQVLAQPDVTGFGTLAHEYQHLLMFEAKSRIDGQPRTEDTWLDEGFSMLAMDLAGYGLGGGDRFVADEISRFQRDPASYSLTDWKNNPNGYSYGLSYLFCRYLVDRFGLSVVRQIQSTTDTGVTGLEAVLAARGSSFTQVFLDFALANRPQDDTTSAYRGFAWFNPLGTYGGLTLPGMAATEAIAPRSLTLRPWGMAFVDVLGLPDAPRTLTLEALDGPLRVLNAQRKEGSP